LPTVTTTVVSDISQTTAVSGGDVTSDGGSTVTARGVCWNTIPNPLISDIHSEDGSGTGIYTSNLTSLAPNTPYYVRSYATNSVGTAYGNEIGFIAASEGSLGVPCPGMATVTYAGKVYNTVQIGTQCWLRENLNVGVRIDGSQNQTNNQVIEKYCYDNMESNCDIYGGLYQWNEAMQYYTTEGVQGICPAGWHLPTDGEWCILTQCIDPTVDCGSWDYSGTDGGSKMKSTVGWYYNGNGTNTSGFTAFPGGYRYNDESFEGRLIGAIFWSSTRYTLGWAFFRGLSSITPGVSRGSADPTQGLPVRCVMDN
jgi:uncharacterized protein (TIGR02145 family)